MQKIYFTLLISLLSFSLSATHNRAGEILYKRIAPYTSVVGSTTVDVYNYEITVIKYTDHGMNVADRCVDTVYFGDGAKGVALRANGNSYTCGCNSGNTAIPCGSVIINQPGYVVKKSTYIIQHTFPGPGNYLIRSSDPNRNAGIINMSNSANLAFYIETLLIINSFTGNNSSPVLNNPPIGLGNVGACYYHNSGAIDADGDSLSYELVNCKGYGGNPVTGYSIPAFGPGGYFFLNSITGLVSWCSPITLGEYNIAFVVKEWRKNTNNVYQLIGSVTRDMQILVESPLTGIDNNSKFSSNIQLSPNPFSTQLNMNFSNGNEHTSEIKLFSSDGRLLFSDKTNSNKMLINTENFAPGIYFLLYENGNEVTTKKVIKE